MNPNVWDQIASEEAPSGTVVRRVLPELVHDVFVGEQRPTRERVLHIDIADSLRTVPPKQSSRGLNVAVESKGSGTTSFWLSAASNSDNALFSDFAADVIDVLANDPGPGAATRVLERVTAWQAFFAQRPESFGPERAAGLFAELVVLRDHVLPALGPVAAMAAWSGPDPAIQDFQHSEIALEVKSFRGTGPGYLTISSERQLETVGVKALFVAYLRIDQRREGTGLTLADTVGTILTEIAASSAAIAAFEAKLLQYGWHHSYSDFRYERHEIRSDEVFIVDYTFPRIVSTSLPNGVGNVSYRVDRSAIESFRVRWDEVSKRLLGED
ncbi:hypothetical protein FHT40_005014 [Mycolicibacterium sp. BK556]|uniref:PD-(D/E)XK motif protein n=1 Tax=unclassified Mycolicibacterium TaxID=2636767 RepID=UPI001612081C|nr:MULTISPECIES: PD-(D/E)XK motif protein [unclassified Mycolicibacterium]MBB3605330.1 hypothetical protein [Mycolicibacterium sp. BK556]MBB3635526.1 hypothetical protein [Mycolicibacterium sp. BK607]